MSTSYTTPVASTSGGFGGTLTIVFIVLKLLGTISWSWWWVTVLIWGPVALLATCALLYVAYNVIRGLLKK